MEDFRKYFRAYDKIYMKAKTYLAFCSQGLRLVQFDFELFYY